MINSDMMKNVEEMKKYFEGENRTEVVQELDEVLNNLKKAFELHKEQNPPEETDETKPSEEEKPIEEEKLETETKNETEESKIEDVISTPESTSSNPEMAKRDKTLNIVKNDPELKDAWLYIFRGKILKFWTPHGTNWPMHLLLSDDGYGIVLKGKKKWEVTIRLDDIDGIWKGYFADSPFAHPKKLFSKSK